jgi:hypothetical protein
MSGQIHATVALLPGKVSPLLFEEEVVWVPERVLTLWRREISLHSHLYPLPWSRIFELRLHSPIYLHGVVLN